MSSVHYSHSPPQSAAQEPAAGFRVPADDIRRILIVSHSYTPFLSPRAFRWSTLAGHWAGQGRRVDVVCAWIPGQARQEVLDGVRVLRVGGALVESLRARFRPGARATTAAESSSRYVGGSFTRSPKSALRVIHDFTWKQLYWPDYACLWIPSATEEVKKLSRENDYDALITVSDPFTSHIVGLRAGAHTMDATWLVDIGDPFCFRYDTPANNQALYHRLNKIAEGRVFAKAGAISVTTESTKQKYAGLFPDAESKTSVIPPVMAAVESNLSDAEFEIPESGFQNKPVRFVFVGTLYRQIRRPDYLLRLFAELMNINPQRKLELSFYGGIDDCQEFFTPYSSLIGENLHIHGLVSRDMALAAMSEADVLVNIGNGNPYQLPSKVIEYACLGKPILHLSTGDKDCASEFLRDYEVSLTLETKGSEELPRQARRVSEFINHSAPMQGGNLSRLRSRFKPETVANQYLDCIQEARGMAQI